MNKKYRNNHGVSLITLVVTIVVIIILAGITIYYGLNQNIDKTSEAMALNEIFEVSEAVAQRRLMKRLNESKYPAVGNELTDSSAETVDGIEYGSGWYLIDSNSSAALNLENINGKYLINYDTGEVVSVSPIYYQDHELYTASAIREIVGSASTILASNMYNQLKGVNRPILVTGMIPVRSENGKWIVTNADDEKWYDYSAETKAWANVMLTDDIVISGYTNDQIRNAKLSDLEGLEVTTTGSMFVWIPRYTSNSDGEVVYSNLTNDYLESGYSLSEAFTSGITELTGIWLSKYDAEYGS